MQQAELKQTIINFLNKHKKGVFAILDEDGEPTTSLMLYVIDDDLNVFFGSKRSFGKYDNILRHPVVGLSVPEEDVNPMKIVDIRGDVELLSSEDQENVYHFFKSKNTADWYVEGADDFVMFKLVPHFVRWIDAESGELDRVDLHIA